MIKKNFKKFILYIIYLTVLFVSKIPGFNKFQLMEINASRVSNLVMETEIFYREKNSNKIYLIFFYKISNKYFIKLFLDKIKENKKVFVLPGYFIWKISCDAFYLFSKKQLQYRIQNHRKKSNFFKDKKPFLPIVDQDLKKGYDIIKKFGIGRNDKWICVYNRDEAYLKNFIKNKDWTYHNFRNFPIQDLEKSINYFIKKNYFVIRVGSISEGSLNISSNKYFDYSKSNIKSDFMDFFLLSKCEMFFGGSSGICLLTTSSRKPYFLINNSPLEGIFSIERNYPAIFKRAKDLKTNKVLSIKEMVDRNISNTFMSEDFKKKGVININNTEEEILEFAKEAVDIIEGNKKVDQNFKEKHKIFIEEVRKDPLIGDLSYNNPVGKKFLLDTKIN